MKRLHFLTTFFACLLFCTTNLMAQSSRGDKLFLEGQNLQKTMTIASQNAAIKKFNQAKVAYSSADKKSMCDNQIGICNENIKRIKQPKPVKKEEPKPELKDTVVEEPVVQKRTDVTLSLSVERLDFKSNPKGVTQSVKVECNYEDWQIANKPDWVSIYITEDRKKFSVEVEENDSDDPRSGVVVVQCEDKTVNLVINQNKRSFFKKMKGNKKH
ncbi:MAG: BACON domain-containing protein [Prevotella sp.]|nr:BACON domain-containing protein [Prevotella sp.]